MAHNVIKTGPMIKVKEELKSNNKISIGSWITIPNRIIAEIMKNAGYSWVCIDLEHTMITLEQAGDLIAAIDSKECSPLVRLSSNDSVLIKRVMDAGAHGVIVPMVKTKDDVLNAFESMHYPPLGKRGVGLARAQKYGVAFDDYQKWLLENSVLIAQIEHIDAVQNIKELLEMNELDGYIVGPYDLSASMGIAGEFDHPDFISVMKKIEDAIKKYNKPGGLHVVEPDTSKLKEVIEKGYRFIAYSVDMRMLDKSCREGVDLAYRVADES
ncbi:6 2,4-dihydroxyhept-2-ene-1,7-dioic acid aldolase [Halobacteriovorax marinus SJ]|uniref:6 2,4-dihydroxyhept-2-ene-1,7-dioic acid aldolase n=2 Tax=Halobacteriovorax marinus TaxID=97084 RepID=E1X3X6_HALMS|nr:6 2,4-dihydroxyhept-2-ene-1,7-dioic acid aldolase [Halobacteriovorax marinus SJ]